ncbi:3-hydroxyacyl-[acyl-carrier-protein] dehydratase [Paenibacillus taihuensis]|uniref:3-hydroxyacyl-[acyl-carrier-protein] dehydratase n=1 Tax=Paenibacillus taihuensis TaxID=1156355 RepID=A0A3D9RZD3_9BACL|nr:3-hydroxyacyl-ACP dehydratase FabZ [Paenibacillus taihuensis]REE85292.1 3-hydroxyacyl-[acyl-carrier-protein] dehydratase [Paenibacillus taihuensis]
MLNSDQIKALIPHRYPFLLVDRIVELDEGKRAVGIKNVTENEPYGNGGHFPGVLIVEALAQVGGVIMAGGERSKDQIGLLTGIDNCQFGQPVGAGDQLVLTFEVTRHKGQIVKGRGVAKVGDEIVCEAEIMFAFSAIS